MMDFDSALLDTDGPNSPVPTEPNTPPDTGSVSAWPGDENAIDDDDEGSDSDLEIITDRVPMSIDNRKKTTAPPLPPPQPLQPSSTNSSLTTEYTPRDRTASLQGSFTEAPPTTTATGEEPAVESTETPPDPEVKPKIIDPSRLPPVKAPSSHPPLDIAAPGMLDGRSIFEHDMDSLVDKAWRRPGSNIADWFNYGFDEISWEAYCYRRRQLGEDATVLRANVINFSGLQEDQVTSLPPDARAMVMTGTTALMNSQQNAAMMGGGMVMNPMMGDMASMQMPLAMMPPMGLPPMTPDMVGGHFPPMPVVPQSMSSDPPEMPPQMQMPLQEPVIVQPPPIVQNQGPSDYLQEPTPPTEPRSASLAPRSGGAAPPSREAPVPPGGPRATRGVPPSAPSRARAAAVRGRGRGGVFGDGPPAVAPPPRAASPLPPNVPTGPRSQTRYKDRDTNGPPQENLDYGGHGKDYHREYDDDRSRSRKRRASPSDDYSSRGSKRR